MAKTLYSLENLLDWKLKEEFARQEAERIVEAQEKGKSRNSGLKEGLNQDRKARLLNH